MTKFRNLARHLPRSLALKLTPVLLSATSKLSSSIVLTNKSLTGCSYLSSHCSLKQSQASSNKLAPTQITFKHHHAALCMRISKKPLARHVNGPKFNRLLQVSLTIIILPRHLFINLLRAVSFCMNLKLSAVLTTMN